MLMGAHILLYSEKPELDRAFFRDVLELRSVDAGGGWLIFALPAAEAALHPTDGDGGQAHGGRELLRAGPLPHVHRSAGLHRRAGAQRRLLHRGERGALGIEDDHPASERGGDRAVPADAPDRAQPGSGLMPAYLKRPTQSIWLAVRSIAWAILLPGVVAGYVPWRFFGLSHVQLDLHTPVQVAGLLLITVGGAVLAVCIWEFAARGRGTLAPMDPPQDLVVSGLYRYVRNPMYLGVATVLLGELILTRSRGLLGFAAAWFVVVNLFVIGYEEPNLRRRFGASYDAYTGSIGRWLPTLRGSRPTG